MISAYQNSILIRFSSRVLKQQLSRVTLCLALIWRLGFSLDQSAAASPYPLLMADMHQSSSSVSRSRINGISYEVWGGGNTSIQTDDNRVRMSNGRDVVEIRGGRVYFNGKAQGVVTTGASIVLNEAGKLSITP